jgi:putative cardiolipin synthase
MKQTQNEILIVSPYFVPLEQFREFLGGVIDSGVNICLVTNSLAATDHTYAFSGYYIHRRELLDRGVEIYELRPDAAMWSLHRTESSQAKFVALHAKVVVLDRRWVYVGSMNFDPRAAHWNTELGLLVESEALANEVIGHFSEDLSPASSWRVERRPISEQQSQSDSGGRYRLYWIFDEGETIKEPSRGWSQRLGRWFYSLLPIEEQL